MLMQREIDEYVLWAEANLPLVRMLGTADVRRIVRRALGEVGPARAAISVTGVTVGAIVGVTLPGLLSRGALPYEYRIAAAVVGAALIGYGSARYVDMLVKRRIKSIAADYGGG